MRQDRWNWLVLFIGISVLIHGGAIYKSRALPKPGAAVPQPEIEVALQPLPDVTPAPPPAAAPKQEDHKAPPPLSKTNDAPITRIKTAVLRPAAVAVPQEVERAIKQPEKPVEHTAATQPEASPGGLEKIKDERPMAAGLPSAQRNNSAPKLDRALHTADTGGGGAPAPSPISGGKGGASTPETPPDDLVYNGGGAGGATLPHTAPRLGGGGGRSILGVEDPLAKDAVPEDKPGIGPGPGGGQGLGAGSGVGAARGAGIGTRPGAGNTLSSLRSKPGTGIGAGTGNKIGTNAPGGGHGTGAELPGTGGTGAGYGRGKGIGIGEGSGVGVGNGAGGGFGTTRGVPFGDVAGLLGGRGRGGGTGGGPGGTGRGSVFGTRPGVGKGVLNVVYVLDCSGSMREGNKLGKAKEALKRALSELKPTDTFNVLSFNWRVVPLSPGLMLPATREIIDAAMLWIDNLRTGNHTNISGAMGNALGLSPVNCVYLMSDGEPEGPETLHDPNEIRAYVKQCNTQNAKIMTLALCLGEKYPGEEVMRGLAEDTGGEYNYIDLSRIR